MILEGIVTTVSLDGVVNIAPMGPHFDQNEHQFELKPFQTSTTYQNLCQNPSGVFHVVDDVLLIAKSAIHQLQDIPELQKLEKTNSFRLKNCVRWYEFTADEKRSNHPRKLFNCTIVETETVRSMFGFNRAKHAVLEATILATRVDFIPHEEIWSQYERFEIIVQKTGGIDELEAFKLLQNYVAQFQSS